MDNEPNQSPMPAAAAPVISAAMPKPSWSTLATGSFSSPDERLFIHRVYGWMCGGLAISAIVAYLVAITPAVAEFILGNRIVFYALLIAELCVVIFLAKKVHTMSSTKSSAVFLLYSALNGLTLSVIFFVYSSSSIVEVFLLTAGIFGVMSLYGFVTKTDLTTVGNLATMLLLGLVVASLVNLFFMNDMASLILAYVGVVTFVLLTAYDTQKLKWMYQLGRAEGFDGENKEAINGALTLYLDFINLFLSLLRIFGKRR